MNKSELVAIREYAPGDKNFIFSTFLLGLYYGNTWFKEIDKDVFMAHYHKILEGIIAFPSTEVRVACLKDDTDVILGYAIVSKTAPLAHWCFVKSAWRQIGIAKSLVSPETKVVTHISDMGLRITKKKAIKFNPFDLN